MLRWLKGEHNMKIIQIKTNVRSVTIGQHTQKGRVCYVIKVTNSTHTVVRTTDGIWAKGKVITICCLPTKKHSVLRAVTNVGEMFRRIADTAERNVVGEFSRD